MNDSAVKFEQQAAPSNSPQFLIQLMDETYTDFFLGEEKVFCQIAQYLIRFQNIPSTAIAVKESVMGNIQVTSWEVDKEFTHWKVLSWANLTRETYDIDLPKMSAELKAGEHLTPKSTIENISLIEPVYRHNGRHGGRTSQNAGLIRASANEAKAFLLNLIPKQLELHRLANLKKLEIARGPIIPFKIEVTTC